MSRFWARRVSSDICCDSAWPGKKTAPPPTAPPGPEASCKAEDARRTAILPPSAIRRCLELDFLFSKPWQTRNGTAKLRGGPARLEGCTTGVLLDKTNVAFPPVLGQGLADSTCAPAPPALRRQHLYFLDFMRFAQIGPQLNIRSLRRLGKSVSPQNL